MKVLVAGATGGLGRSLVPQLIAAGHEVTGMTRSESGASSVRSFGADVVLADGLDAAAVRAAVEKVRPEVVVGRAAGAEVGRLRGGGHQGRVELAAEVGAHRRSVAVGVLGLRRRQQHDHAGDVIAPRRSGRQHPGCRRTLGRAGLIHARLWRH